MAEFEEQLNHILSDPQAMAQIMNVARSLSGGREDSSPDESRQSPVPEGEPEETGPDPEILRKGIDLVKTAADKDKGTILMEALRPYLKEEKQKKLDRALRMSKTTRLIRTVIRTMGEGGRDV